MKDRDQLTEFLIWRRGLTGPYDVNGDLEEMEEGVFSVYGFGDFLVLIHDSGLMEVLVGTKMVFFGKAEDF